MRKWMSIILVLTGIVFLTLSTYQYFEQKTKTNHALAEARQITSQVSQQKFMQFSSFDVHDLSGQQRKQTIPNNFSPEENDVIGVLNIPKLEKSLPIIEGANVETLKSGVGRYSTTAFPGEEEQVLLSGHRDTVFRHFGELEVGDRFILEMPYGNFEYEMKEAEIVGADDTTVIGPKGEEVLTLTTCYPFRFIGDAPDRYIIYAYPVDP